MKLSKIDTVLKFKQLDGMKKYIDFNTETRTNAANSFEKKKKIKIDDQFCLWKNSMSD